MLTYGIVAPAGTPRPIVDKLNKVLRDALATDEVKRRLAQEGVEPMPTTPEEHCRRNRPRGHQMVGDHQVGRYPSKMRNATVKSAMKLCCSRSSR